LYIGVLIVSRTLAGHTRFVISVSISSDGRYVVSGSKDKTVKIWDMAKTLPQVPKVEQKIFQARVKEALIITCCKYRAPSTLPELPSADEDGRAMKKFVENECLFLENDIIYLPDKPSAQTIERNFKSLEESAATLSRHHTQGLYFIYYSGHGTLEDGHTWGHTVTGEKFDLDQMAKSLSAKANTFVIAFFDCCRQVVHSKGASPSQTASSVSTRGQLVTIYGSPPREKAMSFGTQQLSIATKEFLDLMRSNQPNTTFRLSLFNWPMKAEKGIQVVDQADWDIYLK